MFCDSETRLVIYLMLYTHTCPKQTSKRLFSTISRFFFEIWMFKYIYIYIYDTSSFFFFRREHSSFLSRSSMNAYYVYSYTTVS